ncbi:MAG: mannitol dehydrogenase family protein [Alphaproteobacteria bacterium]|nr:mannitol dehydrogenase family protein [Alphaproteobacteria bacterium]NCQ88669.1 mannitol dehydrogenase family protein [Alphaproteobacteria bacterium]NCT06212.1 mannitol dehydrogenase family protein [Alphaproteobacteria bacterium]
MTQAATNLTNMPISLNQNTLEQISAHAPVPNYERSTIKCGIVHMSVGGFHRAHQAVYMDDVLSLFGGDWGICGVGLLPNDLDNINALKNQDGLYTVLERQASGDVARVIGSMVEVLHAPTETQKVLDKLSDPMTKILSLTVTEKGYCYKADGNLDQNNPLLQEDLKDLSAPKTAMGYIVAGLKARKEAGISAYTVMSCDNLPGNGHLTQKLVLQFATLIDTDLARWIQDNVTFPNAMVDRITPVTTQPIIDIVRDKFMITDKWPVVCEDYRQWVLEDKFVNGRPQLEEAGVQLVADVDPYEKMKVRLLNGSHSALSYLSYLMGYREVDKAMNDPLIAQYVRAYMDQDVTPSVPNVPGVNLDKYKDTLIKRFANPAISDQVQRLAEDGSAKIPNSILPCIEYQLEHGGSIKLAALALAGWFRYLTGVDENTQAIMIKDPRANQLTAAMQVNPRSPISILGITEIFGTRLPLNNEFVTAIQDALDSLNEKGTRETVKAYIS